MGRPAILFSGVVVVAGACATWQVANPRHVALQPDLASRQPISRATAERVFERFTALAGTWRSRSTEGWEGRVTFTFVDGTNLASRDQGHMDKVVWRFEDDDTFTTR